MESCLLLGAAVLAACSDRNTPTAPSTRSLEASAGVIADRPYTWSLKCAGDFASSANWSWTAGGVPITGTSVSVSSCFPGQTQSSSGVRPATSDGFTACVNGDGVNSGACQTWTFDPAGPFKAQLKGTASSFDIFNPRCLGYKRGSPASCTLTATATLNVDS
jgi:hypothetical protein